MIEISAISRHYRVGDIVIEALRGINISIDNGELVAIIGQSGSGKSTLMNILGLLDRPSSGTYRLGGNETDKLLPDQAAELRNRSFGFVFQAFNLLPRLTALDNVALPLLYRRQRRTDRRNVAQTWLNRVGLSERAQHKPHQLSGGERQRVAIARALVGTPAIVLADEPTGALDTRVGQEIMNLFQEINRTLGVTVVIITHNHDIAAQCQRQLELSDGYLIKDTRVGQL